MSETTLNAQDRPLLDQCAKCEQDVLVQAEAYLITEFDAVFHISCFVCEMCGSSFSQASPFVPWNGRPYCQGCHAIKMHSVCAACHEPIRFNDPEGPELMALGKHWHARHLACCICGDVMIRDLANGRARPVPHLEYEGRVYCQTDFPTTPQPQCARCGEGVSADSVAAIGKVWHRRCFTCVDCDCAFPSKTFYVSDGQPTCRRDFHIHNGSICGTCDEPIEGPCAHIPDLKARFHPECFCCVECSKPLESTYFKYKGMPYCEMDMRRLYKSRKYARYEGGGQAD
ncbi:hypothetical protein CXG81DRAFT_12473 [Caulochytrium protostelioides]|uniref:LIM zinc-binding domain-containing protein n=1 Tax=Caulochytrium protostelioides TaxID=1555241 RepID=A0A4P9X765_9FUNG|nr:hypothetical protein CAUPRSCDRAFT_5946 [Caulochytrium protostelioides]RKP01055.1 hypothetical protein CXG81DRAFT_12473 [Caulochytrium protostelioides]|eukprot:RKP01055.1 hypothetical protein CXG81DRAFT_12473 [Caulochytrium protostelioides]